MKIILFEYPTVKFDDGSVETCRVRFDNEQGRVAYTGRAFATLPEALSYVEGAQAAFVASGEGSTLIRRSGYWLTSCDGAKIWKEDTWTAEDETTCREEIEKAGVNGWPDL